MSDGGFNLVWCGEKELDVPARHGLRALLTDALLSPSSLDDTTKREQLDALVQRVRTNAALYAYYIIDEPNASQFPALGRLVAYLRERDPAHLAYVNLFPTYASNEQLGTKGEKVTAYREHVRQYVEVVKPGLISYDHYQFTTNGDTADYFLNLAMIRRMQLSTRPLVEERGGTIVKYEADNCYAMFDEVLPAVEAAIAIHKTFAALNRDAVEGFEISVGIGIDYGEVLLTGGSDYFGLTVNRACKLGEDVAGAGEILITAAAFNRLPADCALRAEPLELTISGLSLDALAIKY